MTEIVPAVLEKSWEDVEKRLSFVSELKLGNRWVQLDITDGIFVPDKGWGDPSDLRKLPKEINFLYEADLMVQNPEEIIEPWLDAGIKRSAVHIESTKKVDEIIEVIKAKGAEVGLAINTDTPNELLYPWVDKIDYIQFMGIAKIGYQGQPFDEKVLHKIEDLRKRHPDAIIQVDGGVSKKTAPLLIKAGADRLAAGSAIADFQNVTSS